MREQKALRAALSTILSISMVLGSVPTAAIAEVVDEATPSVVEVVEEGAPTEEIPVEEVAPVEEEAVPAESAPAEEAPAVEETAPVQEAAPADEPASLELTAASDEEVVVATGEIPTITAVVDEGEEGDLLGHYVEQLFEEALPGNDEPAMTAQMVSLTGVNAAAFDALGPMIAEIAHGSHPSTVLEVPLARIATKTRFTAAELGVDWVYDNGQFNQAAVQAAVAMVRPDTSLLLKYLVYSYPYEMYWFDKTGGMRCGGPSYSAVRSGGEYALSFSGNLKFTFAVAPAYSAGENLVDASQASRAQAAVETAQQIAAQGASSSPYERLKLFNDTICSMVSYNNAAAAGGVAFGDPWQLVYVFDNDDTTNVVCEGYAKAFKYLCDLANITGVTCSTMSGTMSGGTGAGAHMWDVVNMDDGKNYLVDVTNCDQGTVGYPYQLFIVPFSSGSVSDGYVFNTKSKAITYAYDADMTQLYINNELTISATVYDPSQYNPDAAAAQVVIDRIAALPAVEDLTLENANAVSAARTAYDALTADQKSLVDNYATLQAAEAKIAELQQAADDAAAAQAVIEMISHLPAVNRLQLSDQGRVAGVRAAYDALTDAQKALVTNYAALTAAEAKIAQLQAAADQTAVERVINAIAALPAVDVLTIDNADAVSAARAAYDGLTEAQQALVINYATLTAAEAKISQLQQQAAEDAAAAQAVMDAIAELSAIEQLTLNNADAVSTARTAYNALTETQKALVTNYATLQAAEARITDLTKANAVEEQIAGIPSVNELTLGDAGSVAAASSAYEALTDAQKALVQNVDVLTAAVDKIAELQAAADQQAADQAAVDTVIAKIAAIPALVELTLGDAAFVTTARTAYDALTDAQKALVTNYETLTAAEARITDLTAAQAVEVKIAALPQVDELTLDDQTQVMTARAAYDDLTEAQQQLVQNYNVLKAAEAKIAELWKQEADKEAASIVDGQIDMLGQVDELTLDDASAVAAVRAAYEDLTADQKAYVEKLDKLVAAETRIADLTAAQAVDTKIAAIPQVDALTLDNAGDVEAARTAYDALTDAQKLLVGNYAALEAAEAKIAQLQQAAADAAAAQKVIDAIDLLPAVDQLTLDNAADVAAARTAYDALTDAQKALVTNYEALTAAEAKITALQQAAADAAAAQAVDDAIAALPQVDQLTLDDQAQVAAARTAYDALTDAQKALIQNLHTLTAAEARIQELQAAADQHAIDVAAARGVDAKIEALPAVDELTLDNAAVVAEARSAYNALTDTQKGLVEKLSVLEAAEAKIAALQQAADDLAAAQAVDAKINALPAVDELTLDNAAAVAEARTAYNALTDAQKAYVTNYETLTAAEAKIADLTAANAVDEQIADLPAVDQLTLDDANDVADARAAYDALSDAQQALVTNYPVLKAAEQKIADLQQAAADQAAAQTVIDAIAALQPTDELTLEDADEVAAARTAYDALTDAQKALVTNYETLTAAEAKIRIPLTGAVVEVTEKIYNGKNQTPQVTVTLNGTELTEGPDFTVSTGTRINVGKYTVTVTGTNRYEGTASGTFTITPKAVTVTANDLSKTYGETDPGLTAAVKGTLNSDTINYTLARVEGENVGEYAITPAGADTQGNYTVTFVAGTFTIAAKDISTATVASIGAKTYTGSALKPAPTVKDGGKTLVNGTDYALSYAKNTNAGTATVTITGKGNYAGTKAATFKISPKSVAAGGVTVSSIAKQRWTGNPVKPAPTVKDGTKTLRSGTDYKLTYRDNKEPGTATVTVTGTGNYGGARSVTFRIGAKPGTWKKSGSRWWYEYADKTYPKSQFADIGGARYYFDASGWMVTGWRKVGSYWYYFRSDGRMGANDWAKSGSRWCYLDSVGRMVTGWRTIGNVRYYFDASGYMVTGWKQINKKYYYFESSGAMAKSKWAGNYYVGADGAWVKGKTK